MFKCRLVIVVFSIFFTKSSLLIAQFPDLRFSHITVEQGLSNNEIRSIDQDKDGFIWIGTLDGLNRFDGYNIKVYRHDSGDSTSLFNNYISHVYVDSRNQVWIGTLSGISLYNKDQDNFKNIKVYNYKEEQTNNYIMSIIEDSKGNVLVANDKGWIYQYDWQNKKFMVLVKNILPSNNCMALWNDTILFSGTKRGLFSYNCISKQITNILLIDKSTDNQLFISSIVLYDNKLWIGTMGKGVLIYNLIRKQTTILNTLFHFEGEGSTRINQLYIDKFKNLWIGDAEGIKVVNTEKGTAKKYNHNPNSNYSINTDGGTAIFIDNQQNKWIGTALGGVNIAFDRKKFFNLKPEKEVNVNLSKSIVSSVIKDKENNLWIGYYNEGIDVINLSKNTKISYVHEDNRPHCLGHSTVLTIYQDKKDELWVGTYTGGLEHFNKRTHEFYSYLHDPSNPNSIAGNDVRSIIEDKQENLWLVIHGIGIDKFDVKNNKFYHFVYGPTDQKSIISNWNFKLIIDSYDTIWLVSSVGLCKMNYDGTVNQLLQAIPKDNTSLSSNYLNDIHEDLKKNLWVGTFEGLNYFNRKTRKFTRITTSNGLANDNVKSILVDSKENIWVSTNKGISKIKPLFNNNDSLVSYDIRNYDERDGIESKAFFERAGYLDPKTGEMYFGGLKGLTFFMPDSIKDNPKIPTVVFTDFKLFYRSVSFHDKNSPLKKHISQTKLINLKYSQNVITFEYTALNFIIPGKNQFAYIMEGFDKKWNFVGSEHKATYTNLDPGKYTFRVKASNSDGIWNNSGTSIQIVVNPPFWKSIWALIILIVVILLSVYFIISFIVYREKLKNQIELAKFKAKKTHEIDELKINFFTQISHEFRTPLTLIISPLERLIKQNEENTITSNYFALIYKNAQRLKRLINQLLDFRKNEEGFLKLEATNDDIIPFIKGIAGAFNDLAVQRNINYSFISTITSLFTWFDPDKLDKILYNLISNAFKYTPDKGEIDISVDQVKNTNEKQDEVPEYIRIKVADNGNGIPADLLDKIFSLFYQVEGKRQREGTGIGLALTKELVKLHKGQISVESEVGKGSSFSVLLPLGNLFLERSQMVEKNTNLEEKIAIISSESISFSEKSLTSTVKNKDENIPLILVIEDNSDLLYHLSCELFPFYRVILAADGLEGFNKATEEIPNLIISDIVMPGIDGIALCRKLKIDERTSHIPIILLTARSLEEHEIEGYETGADDYITKPFSIALLLSRINNLIDSRKKLRQKFGKGNDFSPTKVAVNSVDEMFLKKTIGIIEENLSDTGFGPGELTNKLGLSRAQLYRKIKALTNQSVSDFIRTMKLKKAADLLLENRYTIYEVAHEVGFTEQSNFTRDFKQQFGQNPTNYISERTKSK